MFAQHTQVQLQVAKTSVSLVLSNQIHQYYGNNESVFTMKKNPKSFELLLLQLLNCNIITTADRDRMKRSVGNEKRQNDVENTM